jgi:hypothetical protein
MNYKKEINHQNQFVLFEKPQKFLINFFQKYLNLNFLIKPTFLKRKKVKNSWNKTNRRSLEKMIQKRILDYLKLY